jgi:hypothetical protein
MLRKKLKWSRKITINLLLKNQSPIFKLLILKLDLSLMRGKIHEKILRKQFNQTQMVS